MKSFYITTPIYYVNDVPHIGHAYTTIAADVLVRWKRLRGEKVFFLTGTDEHGQNIERIAREKGVSEQTICDTNASRFKDLWKTLDITNDDFIRTTEERHARGVVALWERLKTAKTPTGREAIYKAKYSGQYCPRCEAFKTEDELKQPGNICPDHGLPCEWTEEENYFFRLSDYGDWFREKISSGQLRIEPETRRNEVMGVVDQGLQDFSVSRARVKWGIPIPGDPGHVFYVWIDALSNYITALGFAETGEKRKLYEDFWEQGVVPSTELRGQPARQGRDISGERLHLIGKEIIRFHCLYWPAMLYAAGVPVPTRVFAHGWWTVEGEKMSKTRGNVIDPRQIVEEYGGEGIGVDVLRYFVLREVPFGNDGDFSRKALLGRYNADLANALGNLLNRTLNLVEKICGGAVPQTPPSHELFVEKMLPGWLHRLDASMDRLAFHEALQQIFNLVDACNKHIDEKAPWKLAKTDPALASGVLYDILVALKLVSAALHSFMPTTSQEIWRQLGETEDLASAAGKTLGQTALGFLPGQAVRKGNPVFPRKDQK